MQVNLVDVTAEYLIDFVHFRQSCCSDEEDDDDDDDDDDDVDTASLNASASSSMLPNFQAYLMKQGEEVDEMWHRHVQKVLTETSVSNAINTSQIFPKLYRVCIAWCRQCSQCINCTKTQLEVSLTVFPLTANYKHVINCSVQRLEFEVERDLRKCVFFLSFYEIMKCRPTVHYFSSHITARLHTQLLPYFT